VPYLPYPYLESYESDFQVYLFPHNAFKLISSSIVFCPIERFDTRKISGDGRCYARSWTLGLARCAAYVVKTGNIRFERFEVFTAVTMKNGVFWVVTPCGSCKN
jgi:hypothetical protein